jgi:hypothetical protein
LISNFKETSTLPDSNDDNDQDNDDDATVNQQSRLKTFVLSKLMEMPLSDDNFEKWLNNPEIDVNSKDYYG